MLKLNFVFFCPDFGTGYLNTSYVKVKQIDVYNQTRDAFKFKYILC